MGERVRVSGLVGRGLSIALVLVAACSTPQTIVATKDPATTTAPPDPKNALATARTLHFSFDVSHQISCSQSFETESTWGSYVLTLTPPHTATLAFQRVESRTFGSSRFDVPATPPNHTETRSEAHFEGTAAEAGGVLSLSLTRVATDCAKGESGCGGTLALSCSDAQVDVVHFDDKGRHVTTRAALRCTPGYGLAPELGEGGWKGGLVFADGNGLWLDYPEYGPMEHPPELRPAP